MDARSENFDAKKFVEYLQEEGVRINCDDSQESFKKMELPHFYDQEKFERGQKFFHDHIFAMFYGKLLGLISDLASPEGRAILSCTKRSSEPETAFKRYVGTIFHMCTWYNNELKPGTKLWKSIMTVRSYHNAASKLCRRKNIGQITQLQMAAAQFGFMGYILSRPKDIGIHKVNEEDLKGFVHFWRVIGHLLGIEERFNLCRDSVEETRAICNEFIIHILRPQIFTFDPAFVNMTAALTDGMWCMMPVLNKNVCLEYVYQMVKTDEDGESGVELSCFEQFLFHFIKLTMNALKVDFLRTIQNYNLHFILFCTEKFPFLAYFKFRKTDFDFERYPRQKIPNYLIGDS